MTCSILLNEYLRSFYAIIVTGGQKNKNFVQILGKISTLYIIYIFCCAANDKNSEDL